MATAPTRVVRRGWLTGSLPAASSGFGAWAHDLVRIAASQEQKLCRPRPGCARPAGRRGSRAPSAEQAAEALAGQAEPLPAKPAHACACDLQQLLRAESGQGRVAARALAGSEPRLAHDRSQHPPALEKRARK